MNEKMPRRIKLKRFVLSGILTGILVFGPGPVSAKNWWEKGADLLKSTGATPQKKSLTVAEIGSAFKDALRIGTGQVVHQLGQNDGFNADSAIHIPLPAKLKKVKSALSKVGMSGTLDDLELKLNRAAEVATPKVKSLFVDAITAMTFEDVKAIYDGPEDAATKYFKGKMTPALSKEMQPIVENSLSQVKAIQTYDKAIGQYKTLPFVPDVKVNLTDYVVDKGLAGLFYYIAKEEAAIRKNPVKRTTALLKRVFGAK
jgi:hypothetical protein